MVFYFTGTGNCLYIAKQLEAQPVSIPQVIHQENLHFCDKSIGIVAPVYGHEVPVMVKEFLHKATFDTDYFYMILTYGNRHGGAAELAEQLCRECGVRVDYINVLLMVDNWLPSFDMDEQRRINKNVQGQLDAILSDLKERREMISPVTDTDRAAHRQFLDRMSQMPPDAWQHLLRVTDSCNIIKSNPRELSHQEIYEILMECKLVFLGDAQKESLGMQTKHWTLGVGYSKLILISDKQKCRMG